MHFCDIPSFPGYKINTNGDIYSTITNRTLKSHKNKSGLSCVGLTKNGKRKHVSVNKLLREVFEYDTCGFIEIPNTGGRYLINKYGEVYSVDRKLLLSGTQVNDKSNVVTITFNDGSRKVVNTRMLSSRLFNDSLTTMKPIANTNDMYEACVDGRIYSHYIEDYLSGGMGSSGYLQVCILVGGKLTNRMVHRLIAETLIPNIHGYNQVDHIDGNKVNNSVENLEWVTGKENTQRAFARLKAHKEVI